MNSITTKNKLKTIIFKTLRAVLVTALWVLVWKIAARLLAKDNDLMYLLLPLPETVLKKWIEIAFTSEFSTAVLHSLSRIFGGFVIGLTVGFAFGILTSALKIADWVLSPMLKIIRAVPVVAITILFFTLFKSDNLPIIIVSLMVIPLIWATVHDGLSNPERELYEMARVLKLSPARKFFYIKLPTVFPSLLTASVNALGLAWKSGIAAEVICEPKIALGTILAEGKGMVDYSIVYAMTLTVVILSLIIEVLLKYLCHKFVQSGGNDNA